jgi:hypothetical protein
VCALSRLGDPASRQATVQAVGAEALLARLRQDPSAAGIRRLQRELQTMVRDIETWAPDPGYVPTLLAFHEAVAADRMLARRMLLIVEQLAGREHIPLLVSWLTIDGSGPRVRHTNDPRPGVAERALKRITGRDFGRDTAAWEAWLAGGGGSSPMAEREH